MWTCGSGSMPWWVARVTRSTGTGSRAITGTLATSAPTSWPTKGWSRRCNGVESASNHAFKHHHIHFIAQGNVALVVVQHDQAVGPHHRAEHARTLVAGGPDLQRAVRGVAD